MATGVSAPPRLRERAGHRDDRILRREDADTVELVARIKAGDSHLFECLYERYFSRVYGYLKLMLHDTHEAEDAAQQVFIQVLKALSAYEQSEAPFRAWLFRIARNEGLMRLRKGNRVEVSTPDAVERHMNGTSAVHSAGARSGDSGFADLVERLPLAQRQVLILRFMLDMSPPEIATVIGRTPGAVRKLQHRALRSLKLVLKGDEREPPAARRAPMLVRLRRIPVVRARRFALMGPNSGVAPGFTPALGRHPYRAHC